MKVCLITVVDADEVTAGDLDRASWVYSAESADGPAYMQHVYGVRMPDSNVYIPEHHDYEPERAELAAWLLAEQVPGARVDVLYRWRSCWMPAGEPTDGARRLRELAQRRAGGTS